MADTIKPTPPAGGWGAAWGPLAELFGGLERKLDPWVAPSIPERRGYAEWTDYLQEALSKQFGGAKRFAEARRFGVPMLASKPEADLLPQMAPSITDAPGRGQTADSLLASGHPVPRLKSSGFENAFDFASSLPFGLASKAASGLAAVPALAATTGGGPSGKLFVNSVPSLKTRLQHQPWTLKTLENLPNRAEIPLQTIREQLKRPDVTAAERALFVPMLENTQNSLLSKITPTDRTINFANWFQKSKIVSGDGKPLTVYHGTLNDFDKPTIIGDGMFFTDSPVMASRYADGPNGNVIPVHLSMQRPAPYSVVARNPSRATLEKMGYDGYIETLGKGNTARKVYVVFNKDQVKSAIGNSGIYSKINGSLTDFIPPSITGSAGKSVNAGDMLDELGAAVDLVRLTHQNTRAHAYWGLQGIDATRTWGRPEDAADIVSKVQTNLYRLPTSHGVFDTVGHFPGEDLFGWTRSFEREGIPHVVESQAPVAQRKLADRTPWREFSKADLEKSVAEMGPDYELLPGVSNSQLLSEGNQLEAIQPLLKDSNAPKRLIREDIARAARPVKADPHTTGLYNWDVDLRDLQNAHKRVLKDIADWESLIPSMEGAEGPIRQINQYISEYKQRAEDLAGKLVQHQASKPPTHLPVPPAIRFATADTNAKVEGWPRTNIGQKRLDIEAEIQELRRHVTDTTNILSDPAIEQYGPQYRSQAEARRRSALRELANSEAVLRSLPPQQIGGGVQFLDPGHQSIYDRYQKVLEPYIKKQGGQLVTDHKGHTWLEVPLKDKSGRVELFSIGAGGLVSAGVIGADWNKGPE